MQQWQQQSLNKQNFLCRLSAKWKSFFYLEFSFSFSGCIHFLHINLFYVSHLSYLTCAYVYASTTINKRVNKKHKATKQELSINSNRIIFLKCETSCKQFQVRRGESKSCCEMFPVQRYLKNIFPEPLSLLKLRYWYEGVFSLRVSRTERKNRIING